MEDILNKYNTVIMAEKYSAIYDEALVRFGGGYYYLVYIQSATFISLTVHSLPTANIQITLWSTTAAVHEKAVA